MKTVVITLDERITDVFEQNEIGICSIYEHYKHDGNYITELEWFSPASEDIIISFWYDGTEEDFVKQFEEYAAGFDPDEHAEMWVEHRGEGGCPNSIRELINDADAIDTFLNAVACELAAAIE